MHLGDLDDAAVALGEVFDGAPGPVIEAEARWGAGLLALRRGRRRSAAGELTRSIELAVASARWDLWAGAVDTLGLVAGASGRDADAVALFAVSAARRTTVGGTATGPLAREVDGAIGRLEATLDRDTLDRARVESAQWSSDDVAAVARRLSADLSDEPEPASDVATIVALRAAGLTKRQAEVAQMLGDRRTDQEIAGELYLSVRTVTTHVSTVLRKLGVSSRREVSGAIAALGPVGSDESG